ncbi:MAG TPA: isovaleryl-CoA dehydrogenase [Thermodesulforhabdus norvegica]|uniref:Isovaleryl-CoA dehydrogenase n=1 Tax=Thermodesulforhabdus norvegica TaxID=39841 RepID=A0A7C0WSZ2_9BACT|nr:acyl-CoA dehydrogenase family protein [Deltaproteobacteria bacterium]MBW2067818.1 acyl-CoA dehydrogenase family protein [Deltaproteobacteria bacterium]HDL90604.1 isovaleryl-CoA dehydrogenase [Thermodesulforhabdus norvegica]
MDFQLTEEQRMIKETVYKWAVQELGPIQEKIDDEDWFPPDFFKKCAEIGILGITIDEKYGGLGGDVLMQVLAVEEMSRICPGLAMTYAAHSNLCAHNIHRNASEYLKEKYLPPMVRGEKIGALALTEPNAGSDAMSIRTRAVKKGDKYILNGTKMFITNGPVADILLVYAKTKPELGPKGISAFIVEKDFPGFSVSRKLKKCGMRGSPTGELIFEDCEVPAENLVGQENMGVAVMTSGLDVERVVLAGGSVGMAQQALDYSIEYAVEREQFGQPIANFQMIQQKLADMYARTEAARLLVYRAAELAQRSPRGGKGTELTRLAAAAILFASETATWVCNQAVQIHGGYGYCLEFPVQKLWRDAKLYEIGAGTSEIRRLIIARELTREAFARKAQR